MSITSYFVQNNNIPEYIKSDHEIFDVFVQAYYEWLELQNTGTSTTYADVYKAVGNPGYIVNNQEIMVDIDLTISEFVDYFANEVVPISLEGMATDPKFFIKKIRDLYLAKGTAKSFKLFFKLYYNDNIDVFETRDTVLRASDGKYFAFPTSHLLASEKIQNASKIDYVLSTLEDSDRNFVSTVIAGVVVDEVAGAPIIKVSLSSEAELDPNQTYWVVDANDNELEVGIKAMLTIGSIKVVDGGCLFAENDQIYIQSTALNKQFTGSIASTKQGYVEGLKVRNRGMMYSTSDVFQFMFDGRAIGSFYPTKTSNYGSVEEINNVPLRTGPNNTGFNSSPLVDAKVDIFNNALISHLPTIQYNPVGTLDITYAEPYGDANSNGTGLQAIPFSKSIGVANTVSLGQVPYFISDSDVVINTPASILVENMTMVVGDTISFQTFYPTSDPSPFDDDSEVVWMDYQIWQHKNRYDSDGTPLIVPDPAIIKLRLPVNWDSENMNWKTVQVEIAVGADSDVIIQPLIDALDSESNINYRIRVTDSSTGIDGGFGYGAFQDSEIEGGNDGVFNLYDSETLYNGGDSFEFYESHQFNVHVDFEGQYMDLLEDHHWDWFKTYSYTSFKYNEVLSLNREQLNPEFSNVVVSNDVGYWSDTGFYGKVVSIDDNRQVAKVVAYKDYEILADSDYKKLTEEKYALIIATPFGADGYAPSNTGMPLENVVHQVSRLQVEYTTSTVSTMGAKFWTQDGFLSSSYGGTLHDNYYYSDYAYRIKSEVPFYTWKDKFKTLLHPAGLVLSAEFVKNMPADATTALSAATNASKDFKAAMRFDMSQENSNATFSTYGANADSTFFASNPFEYAATGGPLDASVQNTAMNLSKKTQFGNSWWDFEPTGWTYVGQSTPTVTGTFLNLDPAVEFERRYSTQDSDGEGKVLNVAYFYEPFTNKPDFHKTSSRYGVTYGKRIPVSKVYFEDQAINSYTSHNDPLPADFFATMGDSDMTFKAFDYEAIRRNDSEIYTLFKVDRAKEIFAKKERDLNTAMKETNSLKWVENNKTYYDYEAYERKWNTVNTLRTLNDDGFVSKYNRSYVEVLNLDLKNKFRGKNETLQELIAQTTYKENKPYSQTAWSDNTVAWDYDLRTQINTVRTNQADTETFKDPQVSMRGRRGR